MGPRRLRIEPKKLQRSRQLLQHDTIPLASNVAFPPIFLPPSTSFDPFTIPSPSPLPAGAESDHHALPTAAIVGGGIAGVVAFAATTTVVSTIFGKIGLSCLLGPIGRLLSTCFGGKLTGLFTGIRNSLSEWRPAGSSRRTSNQAVGDDEVKSAKADDTSHRRATQAKFAAPAASGLQDSRPGAGMTSLPVRKLEQDDTRKANQNKRSNRERAINLGHVSFSCDVSARRLHLFGACRTGGTYKSPPASPSDHSIAIHNSHNYDNQYYSDGRVIKLATANYHGYGQPYTPRFYHLSHHPSQSMLLQPRPADPHTTSHSSSLNVPHG